MAKKTQVVLISDISGVEIPNGEGETIEFAYRGVSYAIDVTAKEAAAFDKALAAYLDSAQRVGGRAKSTATSGARRDPSQTAAIREWAKKNGHKVSDRGRISADVVAAYEASAGR